MKVKKFGILKWRNFKTFIKRQESEELRWNMYVKSFRPEQRLVLKPEIPLLFYLERREHWWILKLRKVKNEIRQEKFEEVAPKQTPIEPHHITLITQPQNYQKPTKNQTANSHKFTRTEKNHIYSNNLRKSCKFKWQ